MKEHWFKVNFIHFKHIFLPASYQRKLPEQRHASLVCASFIQMHVYSFLLGGGSNTEKQQIQGLNRKWICVLRGFSLNLKTNNNKKQKIKQTKNNNKKSHDARSGEQEECGKVCLFFLERYSCTNFDSRAGVLSKRSLVPSTPEVGQAFFAVVVQFQKNTFSVVLPHDALSCLAFL